MPRISNANPSQGRNSGGRAGNDRNRNGRDDDMKSESKSSKSASTVKLDLSKKVEWVSIEFRVGLVRAPTSSCEEKYSSSFICS